MEKHGSEDRLLEGIAWGLLLIWWGLSFVPRLLPNGLDAAGTGVILLAVNAVRRLRGIRVRGISLGFGILCLVWGALDLSRSVLRLDYHPPMLGILLGAAGIIIVAGVAISSARAASDRPAGGSQAPQG